MKSTRGELSESLAARWPGAGRTSQQMRARGQEFVETLIDSGARRWPEVTRPAVVAWLWESHPGGGPGRRAAQRTARWRQDIARAVLEEAAALGAAVDPASLVGERIERPAPKRIKPLSDSQAARLRENCGADAAEVEQEVAVVLAFRGGTASEIAGVRASHVDLTAATVAFGGSAARVCGLDGWSQATLRRHLGDRARWTDDALLCARADVGHEQAVESVSRLLRQALRDAGLYGRDGVAVDSIRLSSARSALGREGIEAAAAMLGWKSLDRTADALGYDWRTPPCAPGSPGPGGR